MEKGTIHSSLSQYGLYILWLVSLVATGGSLYFSEIVQFIPCKLCWIQRIFMYPLAIIFGIATYKNDTSVLIYTLPLSITGACIAFYHYVFVQKFPGVITAIQPCKEGIPCGTQYINWFGFITIPFLALCAFLIITILSFFIIGREKNSNV